MAVIDDDEGGARGTDHGHSELTTIDTRSPCCCTHWLGLAQAMLGLVNAAADLIVPLQTFVAFAAVAWVDGDGAWLREKFHRYVKIIYE